MSVEYFTPSEEDIKKAPNRLKDIQHWMENNPHIHFDGDMTWMDFEHLFTEEEKEVQRRWLLVAPVLGEKEVASDPKTVSVEFTAMMEYGKSPRYKRFAENVLKNMLRSNNYSFPNAFTDNVGQALISEASLPCQPFPATNVSKDFSQVPFVLKELDPTKPTYSYRETRTINGKDYYFYFQEPPKDKK